MNYDPFHQRPPRPFQLIIRCTFSPINDYTYYLIYENKMSAYPINSPNWVISGSLGVYNEFLFLST
jgi:hypothetical protein